MSRSRTELLQEALVSFDLAIKYSQTGSTDQMAIDAMSLRLAAGIESLGRLDADVRNQLFGESWPDMWGMRNRIAHGYMFVNMDIIRETLAVDVPMIVATINIALARSNQADASAQGSGA